MKNNVLILIALAVISAVFILQSKSKNFRSGHRGWVSAHVLAIADKASFENNFLGHTCKFRTNNEVKFKYFDRYPVFFAAISNLILSITDEPSKKILLSRHWMNLIYIATFIFVFLLCRLYLKDNIRPLSITLIIASGFYFIRYKDMFHFDQPALLGLTMFIYALKRREQDKLSRKLLVIIAIIAALMGRGYATCLTVGMWLFLDMINIFVINKKNYRSSLSKLISRDAFITFIFVFIFASSSLFYNTYMEAKKRDVSLSETSIMISAKHRTGISNKIKVPWKVFIKGQTYRIINGMIPFAIFNKARDKKFYRANKLQRSLILKIITVLALLICTYLLIIFLRESWKNNLPSKIKKEFSLINLTILLSGFAWLWPMKRLAHHHQYTNMYYIGFYIFFFILLFKTISNLKTRKIILFISLSLYICSLTSMKIVYDHEEKSGKNYTGDMDNILKVLNQKEINDVKLELDYKEYIKGSPYSMCFYIGDRDINNLSRYVITKDEKDITYLNLTPTNSNIFLVKRASP